MRIADADILVLPGGECGPDHWMARWERRMPNAARIGPAGKEGGDEAQPVASLVAQAQRATRPTIIVAHSCGVIHATSAAPLLSPAVRGAFLVAPPDPESPAGAARCGAGLRISAAPLPFPSLVVASRSDPHCSFERAEHFARNWRSLLIDAGDAGHLDAASGRGPWPEGLLLFSRLLRSAVGEPLARPILPA